MTIYLCNLKRLLKKKVNLIFMVIIPLAVTTLIMALLNAGGGSMTVVGIVDYDRTVFTGMLIDNLKSKGEIVEIEEEDIKSMLSRSRIDCAFVLEKGLTDGVIAGKDVRIRSSSIKEANMIMPVKLNLDSFMNGARNISAASGGSSEKFYSALDSYKNGIFVSENITVGDTRDRKIDTASSMKALAACMLFLAGLAPMMILEDKSSRTFYRVFSTPVSAGRYMLESTASFFTLCLLQIAALFTVLLGVFKADFGSSPANMFIVMAVFALVCVALGVAISSISKDMRQASLIVSFISTPMCMLGGFFWDRELMPDILQKISNFIPTTWVMNAVNKVLYEGTLTAASNELLVLLLFALVFFLLGSWRKADIAK